MKDSIEIRRYRKDDQEACIGLLLAKLTPHERDRAREYRLTRWHWQYYGNPNNPDGEPLIWVACLEGNVAGMVCTVPVKVRTPAGMRLGMWGVDFVVSKSLRGKGIGKRLLRAWLATPGIAFVRGWSPVSFKVATGLGFKLLWGFPSYRIILSRSGYFRMLLAKRKKKEIVASLKSLLKPMPRVTMTSCDVGTEVPHDWDALWQKVAASYDFIVERDLAYLRWRFFEHPTHAYTLVTLRRKAELKGVAIVRVAAGQERFGIISDLVVNPHDTESVRLLLSESLAYLKSQGACAALVDLPQRLAEMVWGFNCVGAKFGMILHCNESALLKAGIFEIERWFQGRSDSDEDY